MCHVGVFTFPRVTYQGANIKKLSDFNAVKERSNEASPSIVLVNHVEQIDKLYDSYPFP